MRTDLSQGRLAGTFLVVSAILTTVALTHHPSVGARQPAAFTRAIAAVGPRNEVFHAFVIMMIVLLYLGLVGFAWRRGLQSAFVFAGLVAASMGLAAETCAALIDGFFGPAFGAHLAHQTPASLGAGMQVFAASYLVLQILAKFGLFAMSAAIALWSIDLFDHDRTHAVLGILGLISGAVIVVLSNSVAATLTSHNVALIFGLQAAWYAGAGALMISGNVSPAGGRSQG